MLGGLLGKELWGDCSEYYKLSERVDTSFDAQFENVSTLRWYPWVGKDFNPKRDMMVVRESHYSSKPTLREIDLELESFLDDRHATRKIVAEHFVDQQSANPTFDNVQKVLVGDELWRNTFDTKRWEMLWRTLAFMDVIQRPMKFLRGKLNERPTWEDFRDGTLALLSVIRILKPRLCLVGSSATVGYMKALAPDINMSVEGEGESRIGRYRAYHFTLAFDGCRTAIRSTRQPGSYYSWSKWRDYVFNGYFDLQKKLADALR